MPRSRRCRVEFKTEAAWLELLLLTHELHTGSHIARYRGVEYYQNLTTWLYVCANFVRCPFRLRVRQYTKDPGSVFIELMHPHEHEKMKPDPRRRYPCAISRFVTQQRGENIEEVKKGLEAFIKKAFATEDIIGKVHRANFQNYTLGRISGYVYEELFPPDHLLADRIRKYNKSERLIDNTRQIREQHEIAMRADYLGDLQAQLPSNPSETREESFSHDWQDE